MNHQITIQINDLFVRRSLIFIIGVWSLCLFFPGSYSVDSWNQYDQMIHNSYNDWHSPLLPFMWHILYKMTGKFYSIFIVQMVLYWLFIGFLLADILINKVIFVVGILMTVFLLFIPQYIMKDAQHAISWGLAILLLIQADKTQDRKKKRWLRILSLVFIIYGLYIRINAVISLIPILYIVTNTLSVFGGRVKKMMAVLFTISILIVGNHVVNYKILKAQKAYPEYKWKLLDVVGISKLSEQNYLPEIITGYPVFNYDTLLSSYTPASLDDIYWPKNGESIFPMPDQEIYDALNTSWYKAVLDHPFLYLKNRMDGYRYYLRLAHRFPKDQYWNTAIWIDPNNPIKLTQSQDAPTRDRFVHGYNVINKTFFFDPWFWLLMNLLLLTIFLFQYFKNKSLKLFKTQALIQLSGVFFILSQFLIYQHDRDFRYTYWNVFTCFIGFIYLLRLNNNKFGATHLSSSSEVKI